MTTRTMHRPRTRRSVLRAGGSLASALSTLAFSARRSAAQPVALEHGYAEGDGIRLHYVRAGRGPLIVFLHGNPRSWALWRAQLAEFGRDHLAVAPDLRGWGRSGQPKAVEAYAMPHLLRDLQGLLDHLGRERCILVGHDWGGYLACRRLPFAGRAAGDRERTTSHGLSARARDQSQADRGLTV